MPSYRVECVNPTDGTTVFHTLIANTSRDAKELASRMGYVVGEASEEAAATSDIQRAFAKAMDQQQRKRSASTLVNVLIVFAVVGVLVVLRFAFGVLHPD